MRGLAHADAVRVIGEMVVRLVGLTSVNARQACRSFDPHSQKANGLHRMTLLEVMRLREQATATAKADPPALRKDDN